MEDYRRYFLKRYDSNSVYDEEARKTVSHLFARPSTQEEDFKGIDIVSRAYTLSCRTRDYKDWNFRDWKYQFTIRYKIPSGEDTEYQKILKGICADAFAYCWGEKQHAKPIIRQWVCIDLHKLGNLFRDMKEKGIQIPYDKLKKSGEDIFLICDIRKCAKQCLMGASFEIK